MVLEQFINLRVPRDTSHSTLLAYVHANNMSSHWSELQNHGSLLSVSSMLSIPECNGATTPDLLTPCNDAVAGSLLDVDVFARAPLKDLPLSMHIGGSTIYRGSLCNLSRLRDLDSILILPTYLDILKVICHTTLLGDLLRVLPEPGSERLASLAAQELALYQPCRDHLFEAVRFSGTSEGGQKKSIKIVSMVYLQGMASSTRPSALPTLALKDRRELSSSSFARRLQPATSTSDAIVHILHDADVYLPCQLYAGQEVIARPAFGCTVDLFLTSCLIYEQTSVTPGPVVGLAKLGNSSSTAALPSLPNYLSVARLLFRKLLRTLTVYSTPQNLISLFYRSSSFSPEFHSQLLKKLAVVLPMETVQDPICIPSINGGQAPDEVALLWPPPSETLIWRQRMMKYCMPSQPETTNVGDEQDYQVVTAKLPRLVEQDLSLLVASTSTDPFSQNSSWGVVLTPTGERMFWKRSSSSAAELRNSMILARYIGSGKCQHPVAFDESTSPTTVFYPYVSGDSMASVRLRELRTRLSEKGEVVATDLHHDEDISRLLAAAVTRSDDMFRCWSQSVKYTSNVGAIHQFFGERIRGDTRMRQFYGDGLKWDSVHLSYLELMATNICINGVHVSSLSSIFRQAEQVIEDISKVPHVQIIGHGDLHGGNVMLRCADAAREQRGDMTHILYVDYDTVGHHSPWFDVAKPLYNDCFFPYFYADHLGIDLFNTGTVQVELLEGILHIELNPLLTREGRRADPLGIAFFEIMIQSLIAPFTEYLNADYDHSKQQFARDSAALPHALLACAILTRDFSSRPDMFFANLAIGILIAQTPMHDFCRLICRLL
ncbi:hypothetical protein K474DRAFT_1690820 [Panus rudis PR-1116 ss-1]|nr:hypothetical protein K474DRAFT_1690820 [Panus rudis PR-1116 ss-1]